MKKKSEVLDSIDETTEAFKALSEPGQGAVRALMAVVEAIFNGQGYSLCLVANVDDTDGGGSTAIGFYDVSRADTEKTFSIIGRLQVLASMISNDAMDKMAQNSGCCECGECAVESMMSKNKN